MSSSPALAQLSPARSPSLSAAFLRPSPRDTPSTPPASTGCPSHAPPTPPDSSSRAAHAALSPRSVSSSAQSPARSLSTTLSAAAPQFQTRILDTPIDIHILESPGKLSPESAPLAIARDGVPPAFNAIERGSPTPTQDTTSLKGLRDALPPAFVPAAARSLQARQPEPTQLQELSNASEDDDSHPPNVYINGLPPNFPEEDLLAMTRPFGNVLSVRTFTRHVSDKPSFETLEAAENCIEALRKYRNLHPSFSKQVHKIPGTAYATVPSASNAGPADSFKARMEQLRDTASTNLYMEGLPLDTTEDAVRALVTPYRIMSSRFFHTRLNNPPRLIAFVRLESRQAAEEIIERLHGRLVRGWNDVGCRISVRFADTPEQRELRRTERHGREDEQSPAKMTMAHAALLNLKGTAQYQSDTQSPTLDTPDLAGLQSPNLGLALNNLSLGHLGGPVAVTSPLQIQDTFHSGTALRQQGLPQIANNASSVDMLNAQTAHVPGLDLRLPQGVLQSNVNGALDEQAQLRLALMGMQGLRRGTQQGYTPVERLILQAHTRQQANALGTGHVNGHGHSQSGRMVAPRLNSVTSVPQGLSHHLLEHLPPMSEDDFHASAGLRHDISPVFARDVEPSAFGRGRRDVQAASLNLVTDSQSRPRNHTLVAQLRGEGRDQGVHTRSSTHPVQHLNHTQTSQTLGMPLYDSKTSLGPGTLLEQQLRSNVNVNNSLLPTAECKRAPQSTTTPNVSRHLSAQSLGHTTQTNTHILFTSKSNINLPRTSSRTKGKNIPSNADPVSTSSTSAFTPTVQAPDPAPRLTGRAAANAQEGLLSPDTDADDEGSPVVSPALTYSTRTPATLSPATPYSGFFSDGGDAFKGAALRTGVDGLRKDGIEQQEASANGVGQ
ncbi:hypothetical protein ONZ51_g3295 [Trametes cubensis]|uniref:RRM domain-containing protein n=1 Tax=Trametes cubensis TaxID=1111947 RepID=A0AAD7XE16_9APHY|nr:hypothetical protein ONZ51_g3295 [Trametes cubensis]